MRGPIHGDEASFVLRAAIASAGIAPLPPQLAREAFDRGELEVVLHAYHLRGADVHVVMPSAAFVPARVMLLRDHLVRELSLAAERARLQCNGHHAQPAPPRSHPVRSRPRRKALAR